MPIRKQIRCVGGSAVVLLPKALLEQLDWAIGNEVTITPKGKTVVIAKSGEKEKAA
jgi:antitoxin component of MazEF toxin-antitoxin module